MKSRCREEGEETRGEESEKMVVKDALKRLLLLLLQIALFNEEDKKVH